MRNRITRLIMIFLTATLLPSSRTAAMDIYAEERKVQRSTDDAIPVEVSVERATPEELDDKRRKLEALEKLKEALGILVDADEKDYYEAPPQFMMELYNTVTDNEGYTTSKNPFDAKVVRSFAEKVGDDPTSKLYAFNLANANKNESILEAELHLYRKRSLSALAHPGVLSSPYYVIRVYQVLPDKSLDEPDLHRLLNVHYVGAYSSGWQIFNVKQAVLSWLSGESPNLGLLVAATTIFGHQAHIDFVRRDKQPSPKQPILVLFNDDIDNVNRDKTNNDEIKTKVDGIEEEVEKEEDEGRRRNKRHGYGIGQPEMMPGHVESAGWPTRFHREKKHKGERHRKTHGSFVPKQRSLEQKLTSMDVYERAVLREKLNAHKDEEMRLHRHQRSAESSSSSSSSTRAKREIDSSASSLLNLKNHQHQQSRTSSSSSSSSSSGSASTGGSESCRETDSEACAKRELYVNFRDIGMTSIVAPEGYAAYQCRGHCKSPLSQDQKPTNHATIQGIIHKMNLASDQDVREPCCVPVSLSSISILYRDDDRDGVVLKSYADMAVVSCGCR